MLSGDLDLRIPERRAAVQVVDLGREPYRGAARHGAPDEAVPATRSPRDLERGREVGDSIFGHELAPAGEDRTAVDGPESAGAVEIGQQVDHTLPPTLELGIGDAERDHGHTGGRVLGHASLGVSAPRSRRINPRSRPRGRAEDESCKDEWAPSSAARPMGRAASTWTASCWGGVHSASSRTVTAWTRMGWPSP